MRNGGYIVAYVATLNGKMITGQINMTTNGDYLERNRTMEIITESNGCNEVVITNVVKLTESEYSVWCGEESL